MIGFVGILWSALGFYSALESALNIIFRVGNRSFIHGKWISFLLVLSSLTVLFTSLPVAALTIGWLHRHTSGLARPRAWFRT